MRVNWRSIIYYVDVAVAAILCPVLFHIVFQLPEEAFPSPLQAAYSRLLA